jgi:hypothetical protein
MHLFNFSAFLHYHIKRKTQIEHYAIQSHFVFILFKHLSSKYRHDAYVNLRGGNHHTKMFWNA